MTSSGNLTYSAAADDGAKETIDLGEPQDRSLLPWSHRQSVWVKVLVTLAAGAAVGAVGTLAHRMGAASNIPYGLVLAFLILILSTWCARSRMGISGLAWHLIASSLVVWQLAGRGPGGDVITPIGFSVPMPFFSQWAGQIWLWGVIVVQVAMLLMPRRWFQMPPRRPQPVPEPVAQSEETIS